MVDENRALLDIYARSDITLLCKGNAYNRLQWEDVTVWLLMPPKRNNAATASSNTLACEAVHAAAGSARA